MYADRMRIVEELGCSIARGQRERGRPTQNTPVGEEEPFVVVRVRPSRFWSVRRTDSQRRDQESRYHKGDSGKGYTTGPDEETTILNGAFHDLLKERPR